MQGSEQQQIELEPQAAQSLLEENSDALLVDVREDYERAAGHIADSLHMKLGELSARAEELPRERPIIFYCRIGARSQMAAQAFRAAGYDAYNMVGGLARWVAERRPLLPADGYVAD